LIHRLKHTGNDGFIFKVDFEKDFDSVLWEYLEEVMSYMGFGIKWRNLILECLSQSRPAILINGSPSREYFGVQRGLKHGDPLSPLLFNHFVAYKMTSFFFSFFFYNHREYIEKVIKPIAKVKYKNIYIYI